MKEQLSEVLYKYLKSIDVGYKWCYEYLDISDRSIAFKQISTPIVTKKFINGSYNAELEFIIYVQDYITDTRTNFNITEPLSTLSDTFLRGDITLELPEGYQLIDIKTVTTPEDVTGKEKNGLAIYASRFKLSYRKLNKRR